MKIAQNTQLTFHQFFSGKLKDKIFFLHIPKCGGASVDSAIKRGFGLYECYLKKSGQFRLETDPSIKASKITGENLMDYREKLLLYYMSKKQCKYISGHFSFSKKAYDEFGHEWNFVTVLRHPVSRWFSQYFYNKNKSNSSWRVDCDLETYLGSDEGKLRGSDYVNFFADTNYTNDLTSDKAIQQAIDNLNNFTLVGILEKQEKFLREFNNIFGAKLYLGWANKNPTKKEIQQKLITDTIIRRVEEICWPDIQVYTSILGQLEI